MARNATRLAGGGHGTLGAACTQVPHAAPRCRHGPPAMTAEPRELLLESFRAAVAAADPLRVLPPRLPSPAEIASFRRTRVVGAGKAAASMAQAVERHWPADAPLDGLVVTRHGHGLPGNRVEVLEAGHPLPDDAGAVAARRILGAAETLGPDDLLLVLLSGGGSSLLALPVEDVPMAQLRGVTAALLASGAPIQDINTVRKHLSRIQGGRLAAATRARVLACVVSDVVGDDVSTIASGPCAPDPGTYRDALVALARWRVEPPAAVRAWLEAGAAGRHEDTPKPGDPLFARVEHRLVATARASLEAGAAVFEAAGIQAAILGDSISGEAREVAAVLGGLAREIAGRDRPFRRPVALVSGGECTVTVRGHGRGGSRLEHLRRGCVSQAGRAGKRANVRQERPQRVKQLDGIRSWLREAEVCGSSNARGVTGNPGEHHPARVYHRYRVADKRKKSSGVEPRAYDQADI